MNCKPGDLAVVVRVLYPHQQEAVGRIIRVGNEYLHAGVPHWRIDGDSIPILGGTRVIVGFHDSELRPLRDPGEDAKDETLSWLPVPSRTKEEA